MLMKENYSYENQKVFQKRQYKFSYNTRISYDIDLNSFRNL